MNNFLLKLPSRNKIVATPRMRHFLKPFLYTDTRTLLTQGARSFTTALASQAAYTHAAYGNLPGAFLTHSLRYLIHCAAGIIGVSKFCIAARTGTSLYYLYNLCLCFLIILIIPSLRTESYPSVPGRTRPYPPVPVRTCAVPVRTRPYLKIIDLPTHQPKWLAVGNSSNPLSYN